MGIGVSPPDIISSAPSAGQAPCAESAMRRRKYPPSRSVIQPSPVHPSPSLRGIARSTRIGSSTNGRRTAMGPCGGSFNWCQAAPMDVPAITIATAATIAWRRVNQPTAAARAPTSSQGPGETPAAASIEQPSRRGRASQSAGQCPKRSVVRESCSRGSGLAMRGGLGLRRTGTGPPRRAKSRRGAWRGRGPEGDFLGGSRQNHGKTT